MFLLLVIIVKLNDSLILTGKNIAFIDIEQLITEENTNKIIMIVVIRE